MGPSRRPLAGTILAVALSTFLASCTVDLPDPRLPERILLERYNFIGKKVGQEYLGPQYPMYKDLQALLNRERSGWTRNFVAYAAPRYMFRSSKMIIRCLPGRLVIDFAGKGSYTKKIDGVYRALKLY
jgi:hypothetical protein